MLENVSPKIIEFEAPKKKKIQNFATTRHFALKKKSAF
jgi:hypothetical protein